MATLKTLKTRLVEATRDYLIDRNMRVDIMIDMSILETMGGYVENAPDEGPTLVLNTTPSAINDFSVENNRIYFICRFGGIPSAVEIPTASIIAVYEPKTKEGMQFEAHGDYTKEIAETEKLQNESKGSHLSVVR